MLAVLVSLEASGQELHPTRFSGLNDQQKALLRECVRASDTLQLLYSEYECEGKRRIMRHGLEDTTYSFTYCKRKDGYELYRVMLPVDGDLVPYGRIARPEGHVATTVRDGSRQPEIVSFGPDSSAYDMLFFPHMPFTIDWFPTKEWLIDKSDGPIDNHMDNIINHMDNGDVTLLPVDPERGALVRLKLTSQPTADFEYERTVEFLRDHLWAVSKMEFEQRKSNGTVIRRDIYIDYDLSEPKRPKMRRFQRILSSRNPDQVTELEDYHFSSFSFSTPDLSMFEPQALGLSIPTPATAKTSVWPWRLGMIGGGIVLITLALYLRRRMRD
jgi:hypothetical protein